MQSWYGWPNDSPAIARKQWRLAPKRLIFSSLAAKRWYWARATSPVRISPTLSNDGRVFVSTSPDVALRSVRVYDAKGRLVWDRSADNTIWLPAERGMYFITVETSRGRFSQKVVRQ